MNTPALNCKTYTKSTSDYSLWSARQLATKSYIERAIPNIPIFICDYISLQYGTLQNCIEFTYFYDSFCKKSGIDYLDTGHPFNFVDEKFADWMNQRSARDE